MEPRRWKQLKLATAGGGTACLSRERAVIQTSFSLFERGDMVQNRTRSSSYRDMVMTSKWTIFLPALCLYPGESMEEEFDVMADVLYE